MRLQACLCLPFVQVFHPGPPLQFLGDGARCAQLEHVRRSQVVKLRFGKRHHRLQGVAAQVEEVVQQADLAFFQLQRSRKRVAQDPFRLRFRRNIFRFQFLQIRFRQRLTVHLAVAGHRHFIQLHQHVRHHVFWQLLCHEFLQLLCGNLFLRSVIAGQVFRSSGLPHRGRTAANAGEFRHYLLDLVQFDPETSQLDLVVQPPEDADLPAFRPGRQVAAVIRPQAVVFKECGGALFRQVHVSAAHLVSADDQFAPQPDRQFVSKHVRHVEYRVGDRRSHGHVLFARHQRCRAAHRAFRRSVYIQDHAVFPQFPQPVIQLPRERLCPDIKEGKLPDRLPADRDLQQAQQVCRRACDAVCPAFRHQLGKQRRVVDLGLCGDHHGISVAQRHKLFHHRNVE